MIDGGASHSGARTSHTVGGKIAAHNEAALPQRRKIRLSDDGTDLACADCDLWAPRALLANFTRECRGPLGDWRQQKPPDGLDKKRRKN